MKDFCLSASRHASDKYCFQGPAEFAADVFPVSFVSANQQSCFITIFLVESCQAFAAHSSAPAMNKQFSAGSNLTGCIKEPSELWLYQFQSKVNRFLPAGFNVCCTHFSPLFIIKQRHIEGTGNMSLPVFTGRTHIQHRRMRRLLQKLVGSKLGWQFGYLLMVIGEFDLSRLKLLSPRFLHQYTPAISAQLHNPFPEVLRHIG